LGAALHGVSVGHYDPDKALQTAALWENIKALFTAD
jgi:hypothetical protein